MNPALLLAAFSVREKVSETFTASQPWTAPATTTALVSLVGKGAAGTPIIPGPDGYDIRIEYKRYVGGVLQEETTTYSYTTSATFPEDYCQGTIGSGGVTTQTCYYYTFNSGDTPAATGASASGFGKTFAGGIGGPANAVTYTNVAVTGLASYNLVVPSGGAITITYYK